MTKKILIVDDHPILRRGLAALIRSELGFEVYAEADDCRTALNIIDNNPPDAMVLDLMLNGSDGLDVLREIKVRRIQIPTLVLSMYDEAMYAERALKAGANGYLTKKQLDATVLDALRAVLAGQTYLSDELKSRLANKFLHGDAASAGSSIDKLSDRELQVFQQVGRGRPTRQIAEHFNLSVKTIESHLEHIKQKLTLNSAAELAQTATRWVETGRTP